MCISSNLISCIKLMNCSGCSSTPMLFDQFKATMKITRPNILPPNTQPIVHPFTIKTLPLTNNGKFLKY